MLFMHISSTFTNLNDYEGFLISIIIAIELGVPMFPTELKQADNPYTEGAAVPHGKDSGWQRFDFT